MAATPTSMDAALKETWTESRLAEQLYNQNPFLDRVKKFKNTQVGQQAVTPIHTGRNWSYTALPGSGGTLNTAGQQEMKQATWQYKHHYQPIKIESATIDGTRSDTLSVAEAIDTEVSNGLGDLNRNLTRQLFLNGDALIMQCGTTTTSNTIVLNATSGHNALERGWIDINAVVDIGTTASEATIADAVTVTAVTDSTSAPTIVISGSTVSTTSSHYVSIANARAGTTSYEMNGLQNIVSTSADLGGLTVASVPSWQSPSVDSTSQALTLALMLAKSRQVHQKTGQRPNYVLTSLKQEENFYKLLQTQVRFAGDSVAAGEVAPKWQGMEIQAQPDCQNEYMYFLTIDDFLLVSAGDPYWQNKHSGGNILEWGQGTTAYVATLMARMNLGVRRRNSHVALTGLS